MAFTSKYYYILIHFIQAENRTLYCETDLMGKRRSIEKCGNFLFLNAKNWLTTARLNCLLQKVYR